MRAAWTDREMEILQTYYGMIPANDISYHYLKSRSVVSINKKAFKLGLISSLYKLGKSPKYIHDENYFNIPNIENCYWAGFIGADGYITKNQRILGIKLARKDRLHLNKFKKAINSDHCIYNYDKFDKRTNKTYLSSEIQLTSAKYLCFSLKETFNIINTKSLILSPPNLKQKEYIQHFIRGFMDGDGCIRSNKSGKLKYWSIAFVGTKQFLKWIKFQIQKYVKEAGNPKIEKMGSIFRIEFGGNRQIKPILDWIYKNSKNNIRLDRKYNKYQECLRFLNKKVQTLS